MSEVTWKTSTVLVCKCVSRGRLSQYFLPCLRIYVGGISLVNIGFYQTLHYTELDTPLEKEEYGNITDTTVFQE